MKIEIQELLSKRNSEIDKLNNYLSSGKTPDEKVVEKTIGKIKHSEEMLTNLGFTDFVKVNDDGTFNTVIEETASNSSKVTEGLITEELITNESISSDTTEEDSKINESITQQPKKTLEKSIKIKTDKLAVSIKEINKNNLSTLASKSSRTPNNVVNLMLKELYDEEKNKFKVSFEKKERLTNTSYLIEEKYYKEIDKIAHKTGLSKSDIFNVLLETALKEYI